MTLRGRRGRHAAAVLGAALLLAGPAAARDCRVAGIEGPDARIWNEGVWSALVDEAPLPGAAVKIATGPATRVQILCDDGVALTVGIGTEINLGSLTAPDPGRGIVVQLIEGIAGLLFPGGLRGAELRTPLAIASVRSTRWLVEHAADAGSAVFVADGRVSVAPLGGGTAAVLGPGEGVDVAPDAGAGPVKTWGQGRVDRTVARLGFAWR